MENFSYQCAAKMIFGKATEHQVGKETASFGKNVLFVYGGGNIMAHAADGYFKQDFE